MSVFDKKKQELELWCHICERDTTQYRTDKNAIFTCADAEHPHLSRRDQENGMQPRPMTSWDENRRENQLALYEQAGKL